MSRKTTPKPLALVICLLCLTAPTACLPEFADSFAVSQWRQGCEGFPSVEEVERKLADQRELVQRIEDVSPGHVLLYATECPGGAYITLLYGSIYHKMEIEEILDAAGAREEAPRRIFGIPYRWVNG